MDEQTKFKGTVKAVHEVNKGILIGENWYNAKGNAADYVKDELKGKEVEITLLDPSKRGFGFLRVLSDGVEKQLSDVSDQAAGSVSAPVSSGLDKDRLIVRQACVKAASDLMSGSFSGDVGLLKDSVLNLAEDFEKWVYR